MTVQITEVSLIHVCNVVCDDEQVSVCNSFFTFSLLKYWQVGHQHGSSYSEGEYRQIPTLKYCDYASLCTYDM